MGTGMKPKIVTAFFASLAMLLLPFAHPRATSAEKPKILYALVDTNFDAPTPPSTVFDAPTLIAVNLEAGKWVVSDTGQTTDNDDFKVGVIGSTRAASTITLAICPPQGEDRQPAVAYGIVNTFSPQNQLAKLDLRTGTATAVGSPMAQELDIMAFACSPDGTLYAVGQLDATKPGFNTLYKVERETGSASPIGPTGVLDPSDQFGTSGFLMALSFAPDGTLYGVSDGAIGKGSPLYSINRHSGFATKVANINVDAVMGLAIDDDGKFYVSDFVQKSKIYSLDSGTGLATPIVETHLDNVINIAFKQTPR